MGGAFASILLEILSSIAASTAAANPVVVVVVVVSVFALTILIIIDPVSLNTEKIDTNNTDAISKADAKIKEKTKKGKDYYYKASRKKTKDGKNYVTIGKGINEKSALKRVESGSDVFASSKTKAKQLANKASTKGNAIGPEIDKGKENVLGYYYHYHPNPKTGSHIFYI